MYVLYTPIRRYNKCITDVNIVFAIDGQTEIKISRVHKQVEP